MRVARTADGTSGTLGLRYSCTVSRFDEVVVVIVVGVVVIRFPGDPIAAVFPEAAANAAAFVNKADFLSSVSVVEDVMSCNKPAVEECDESAAMPLVPSL